MAEDTVTGPEFICDPLLKVILPDNCNRTAGRFDEQKETCKMVCSWSPAKLAVTEYLVFDTFVYAINEGLGAFASIYTELSHPRGQ